MSSGTRTPDPGTGNRKRSLGRRFATAIGSGVKKMLHRRRDGGTRDLAETASLSDVTEGQDNRGILQSGIGQLGNSSAPVIAGLDPHTTPAYALASVGHVASVQVAPGGDPVDPMASTTTGLAPLAQNPVHGISVHGIPAIEQAAVAVHEESRPAKNPYLASSGEASGGDIGPKTRVQQAKAVGSVVYKGLKVAVQALDKFADTFPPLKTATQIFLTISELVDTVLENKEELEDLKAKLGIILSIVERYQKEGGFDAITHRIKDFSECVAPPSSAKRDFGHSRP